MSILITVIFLKDYITKENLYSFTLNAVKKDKKITFEVKMMQFIGDEQYVVSADCIKDNVLKEKMQKIIIELQNIPNVFTDEFRFFLKTIFKYPILASKSFLGEHFDISKSIHVTINEKEYIETIYLLNYNAILQKLGVSDGRLENINVENYLINYFYNKTNRKFPKRIFEIGRYKDRLQVYLIGRYSKIRDENLALILNFKDFKCKEKKYRKSKYYSIPIFEKITKYDEISLLSVSYQSIFYVSDHRHEEKEAYEKHGEIIAIEKEDRLLDDVDKLADKIAKKGNYESVKPVYITDDVCVYRLLKE